MFRLSLLGWVLVSVPSLAALPTPGEEEPGAFLGNVKEGMAYYPGEYARHFIPAVRAYGAEARKRVESARGTPAAAVTLLTSALRELESLSPPDAAAKAVLDEERRALQTSCDDVVTAAVATLPTGAAPGTTLLELHRLSGCLARGSEAESAVAARKAGVVLALQAHAKEANAAGAPLTSAWFDAVSTLAPGTTRRLLPTLEVALQPTVRGKACRPADAVAAKLPTIGAERWPLELEVSECVEEERLVRTFEVKTEKQETRYRTERRERPGECREKTVPDGWECVNYGGGGICQGGTRPKYKTVTECDPMRVSEVELPYTHTIVTKKTRSAWTGRFAFAGTWKLNGASVPFSFARSLDGETDGTDSPLEEARSHAIRGLADTVISKAREGFLARLAAEERAAANGSIAQEEAMFRRLAANDAPSESVKSTFKERWGYAPLADEVNALGPPAPSSDVLLPEVAASPRFHGALGAERYAAMAEVVRAREQVAEEEAWEAAGRPPRMTFLGNGLPRLSLRGFALTDVLSTAPGLQLGFERGGWEDAKTLSFAWGYSGYAGLTTGFQPLLDGRISAGGSLAVADTFRLFLQLVGGFAGTLSDSRYPLRLQLQPELRVAAPLQQVGVEVELYGGFGPRLGAAELDPDRTELRLGLRATTTGLWIFQAQLQRMSALDLWSGSVGTDW